MRRIRVVCAAIVALGFCTPMPALAGQPAVQAGQATPDWTVDQVALPVAPNSVVDGTSCVSESFCMAVGTANDSVGRVQTFAEMSTVSGWARVATADRGAYDSVLASVSCVSAGFCVAAGNSGTRPLLEHWDGAQWSLMVDAVGSAVGVLNGVSCLAATDCTAVGSRTADSRGVLVDHWDGTSWTTVAAPDPSPGRGELRSVSCQSSSFCVAVGDYTPNAKRLPLIEQWDGVAWTDASPVAKGAVLNTVSCIGTAFCMAVGERRRGFIEEFSGGTWRPLVKPDADRGAYTGVSCVSSSSCYAVSNDLHIDTWNGATWKGVVYPVADLSGLHAVSCVSTTFCVAGGSRDPMWVGEAPYPYGVGAYVSGRSAFVGFDGVQWAVISGADRAGNVFSVLNDVSCASPTMCAAVGEYAGTSGTRTLIEFWNGVAWQRASGADTGTTNAVLTGVSCVGESFCVAVGDIAPIPSSSTPFIERWNGSDWQAIPSPDLGTSGYLNSVSCHSASFCAAVGYRYSGSVVIEMWDGLSWTLDPPRDVVSGQLADVSCASGKACLAVGTSTYPPYIAIRWNGKNWKAAAYPGGYLNSVSCISATSCTAVGDDGRNPTVRVWNGSVWTGGALAHPGYRAKFDGIVCEAASACFAEGSYTSLDESVSSTLVEAWDGTQWTVSSSPTPKYSSDSVLQNASCVSGFCALVGYNGPDVYAALAESSATS